MQKQAFWQAYQQQLQRILDLLFPQQCVICKKSGHVICPSCLRSIHPLQPPVCAHCCTRLGSYGQCRNCYYHPLRLSVLRVVSPYEGGLRTCVHALKYEGRTRLAEPLGNLLTEAYRAYTLQADLIIPVPLHQERERQRGYNQSVLLARECARHLGIPLREDILFRQRATPAQVGLTAQQRLSNMAGAFVCNPTFTTGALVGRKVLMIDDICTTGATLEACAAPLFAAGVRMVSGLVLARPM